ncbi:hypothetical protein I4U23_003824 [Adineta vaga]|nr:hypothetical protein I4U23_003824 [Adineta vaga]
MHFLLSRENHSHYKMTSHYQLALFDGDDNRVNLLRHFEYFCQIPKNCLLIIFYNQSHYIEDDIWTSLRKIPQIKFQQCVHPVNELLNTLHREIRNYLCVHVICDEQPNYATDLMIVLNKHEHLRLLKLNRSDIDVKAIIHRLQQFNEERKIPTHMLNKELIFDDYRCPRCSKQFQAYHTLEEHDQDNHLDATFKNIHLDYGAKIPFNKRRHPDDRHKDELYCLSCSYGYQTLEARESHLENCHPDADKDPLV